jgi:hypothetical protein
VPVRDGRDRLHMDAVLIHVVLDRRLDPDLLPTVV